MSKPIKVVFMGTPAFATGILEGIMASQHQVVGVVTVADKPAGRGQRILESDVKKYALSKNLKILQPTNLKDPGFLSDLNALGADVFFVVAFRYLPKVVWEIPPMGTVNLHASLLPYYRGAAPINRVIMDGAKETGLSTFIINEKIDCGAVLMQEKMVIGEQETAGELHDRMIPLGADLSVKTLDALAGNGVEPQKQTLDGVSYPEAPKIFREDCEIDWNWPLERINNHVRGLSPYPAAFTHFKKNDKSFSLKIFRVEITREENNELTRPNLVYDDKGVFVIHPQGICRILELQVAGKKRMSAQEYVNGLQKKDHLSF